MLKLNPVAVAHLSIHLATKHDIRKYFLCRELRLPGAFAVGWIQAKPFSRVAVMWMRRDMDEMHGQGTSVYEQRT